ncbi:hypothetical protein NDU88_003371 [Pleurodeles waltl]|uniref:Uncharacterized protein n=1 Tax=Pleurodeles waltl TaxID=8319 RepID=A0AAV7RGL1_PLEWA|nr:hypothetical protein NDU88_003371 [Pleurodeles waltl]
MYVLRGSVIEGLRDSAPCLTGGDPRPCLPTYRKRRKGKVSRVAPCLTGGDPLPCLPTYRKRRKGKVSRGRSLIPEIRVRVTDAGPRSSWQPETLFARPREQRHSEMGAASPDSRLQYAIPL